MIFQTSNHMSDVPLSWKSFSYSNCKKLRILEFIDYLNLLPHWLANTKSRMSLSVQAYWYRFEIVVDLKRTVRCTIWIFLIYCRVSSNVKRLVIYLPPINI